jgi:hypothetical protein
MMMRAATAILLYAAMSLANASILQEDFLAEVLDVISGGDRAFEEMTHRRFIDSSLAEQDESNRSQNSASAHRALNDIEEELGQQAPLFVVTGCAVAVLGLLLVICAHKRRRGGGGGGARCCNNKNKMRVMPSSCFSSSSTNDGKHDHTCRTTTDDDPVYLVDVGEVYMQHFRKQEQEIKGDGNSSSPMMVINIV